MNNYNNQNSNINNIKNQEGTLNGVVMFSSLTNALKCYYEFHNFLFLNHKIQLELNDCIYNTICSIKSLATAFNIGISETDILVSLVTRHNEKGIVALEQFFNDMVDTFDTLPCGFYYLDKEKAIAAKLLKNNIDSNTQLFNTAFYNDISL